MSIILASGKKINFTRSIENPINVDILKQANFNSSLINLISKTSDNNRIYCWALADTSNAQPCIKNMKAGDYIFFSQSSPPNDKDSGNFTYYGVITHTTYNDNLNKLLWFNSNNENPEKWNFIIFIKNIKRINQTLTKKEVMNIIGSPKNTLQVPLFLTNHQEEVFLKEYANYIKYSYTDYSTYSEISVDRITNNELTNDREIEIQSLKNFIHDQHSADIDFNIVKTNLKGKSQTATSKNFNLQRINLTDSSKKLIGWIGEQRAYNTINENINIISQLLNINKNDITEIEWFNKTIDIAVSNWIDKSINKGCDIKIKFNNSEEIKLEVKSSYNSTNEITLTRNELRTMKDSSESNYYIVLISNLKNLHKNKVPTMTLLKKFTNEIPDSYLEASKSHTLFARKIISKYKLTL